MASTNVSTYPAGSLPENPSQMPTNLESVGAAAQKVDDKNDHDHGPEHELNPSQMPTDTASLESVGAAQKVDQKCDHGHELNGCDESTHPSNTLGETNVSSSNQHISPSSVSSSPALESSQNQLLASETGTDQGHDNMASSNLGTDPVAANGVADGSNSNSQAGSPAQNCESSTNGGPEIQNPPLQVMERSDDPTPPTASMYKIPSHVFDRTSTTTPVEWSTASNESLFSIHVGTMSFTKEVPWFKSGDLDKYGDMSMLGPPNSLPSTHQPPAPPTGNKFNDMSQRTAEQLQGSGVTEAKAAETMREVIMENTERIQEDELSTPHGNSQYNVLSNPSDKSGYSDGSTKSFAFQPLTGEGGQSKAGSARHSLSLKKLPEKEKLSEPSQSRKETTKPPAAAAADEMPKPAAPEPEMPKPAPTTSNNKWLSCFACCPFCH